jgi:hypothetical protein
MMPEGITLYGWEPMLIVIANIAVAIGVGTIGGIIIEINQRRHD